MSSGADEEFKDYSWVNVVTSEQREIEALKAELKELKRQLKFHIQNCPFREIK